MSRRFNSRFDSMIKGFWKCPKYRGDLHLQEIEWDLNSFLILYVDDIFEWELCEFSGLICG